MDYTYLKIIIFMWQCGFVDTFTVVNFLYNVAAQYGAIVVAAMADGNVTNFPGVVLEPIAGLGLSYKFVKAAQTAAERQARVATLAALLSASTATSLASNSAANPALGGAVAAHIIHMRHIMNMRGGSILARGRSLQITSSLKEFRIIADSIKTPVLEVHPYRAQFSANCKLTISNIFRDHTARRYGKQYAQKIKRIYLAPVAAVSTPINTTALIGWTCFGLVLIGSTTLAALYLFQRAERKRWQNQNHEVEVIIDITASLSD